MSPKEKKYTERIAVFFTKEQLEQVRAEAERLGLDVSAYVRMASMNGINPCDHSMCRFFPMHKEHIKSSDEWDELVQKLKLTILGD